MKQVERKSCCWSTEDESRVEGIEGESAVKRREEWREVREMERVASALAAQPVPPSLSRQACAKSKAWPPIWRCKNQWLHRPGAGTPTEIFRWEQDEASSVRKQCNPHIWD